MEAIEVEQKRPLRRDRSRLCHQNKKATDEANVQHINEAARKRHATKRAEDPAYDTEFREYSKAQYMRSEEARENTAIQHSG